MAKFVPNPIFTIFSSGNTVDPSGTVDTYTSGASSVRQALYHESSLTNKHQNPVDFDSLDSATALRGDPSITYRTVVKDGSGNTLHTTDGLIPITTFSDLSSNLDVSTFNIVSPTGQDLAITSDSVGRTVLDGLKFPYVDGNAGEAIMTNGSGNLFFGPAVPWDGDTTPQLGGDLDANTYSILFDSGTGIRDSNDNEQITFTTTGNAVNYINITNTATGVYPLIAAVGSDTDVDLNINPKGTGRLVLDGLSWPASDGSAKDLLITDGSASIGFRTASLGLVQRQATVSTASFFAFNGVASTLDLDDTVPNGSEGTTVATTPDFTPAYEDSRVIVTAIFPNVRITSGTDYKVAFYIKNDITGNILNISVVDLKGTGNYETITVTGTETTTSSGSTTTYSAKAAPIDSGTAGTVLTVGAGSLFSTTEKASISADELV